MNIINEKRISFIKVLIMIIERKQRNQFFHDCMQSRKIERNK